MEMTIVKVLLVLVIAAILIMITPAVLNLGEETIDRASCKDSVALRAKSKLNILSNPLLETLNCETNLVELDDKDIGDEDDLHDVLALEIGLCWDQFGKGKQDFLAGSDFGKGDNWCFICSRIDIDEEVSDEIPSISIHELHSYMLERPISGSDNLYDFIYGEGVQYEIPDIDDTIDTKQPIYVMFFADKRFSSEENPKSGKFWSGPVLGCVAGSGFGPIGCGVGAAIYLTTDLLTAKRDYISALYYGNSNEVIEKCNQ
jgi:hypothetical protein